MPPVFPNPVRIGGGGTDLDFSVLFFSEVAGVTPGVFGAPAEFFGRLSGKLLTFFCVFVDQLIFRSIGFP